MQVLVVEDDMRLAQALGHILKENGYDADVVRDGLTGLAYGEDGRYDVIILDVMLPKMDGFAVASALRRKGVSAPCCCSPRATPWPTRSPGSIPGPTTT